MSQAKWRVSIVVYIDLNTNLICIYTARGHKYKFWISDWG